MKSFLNFLIRAYIYIASFQQALIEKKKMMVLWDDHILYQLSSSTSSAHNGNQQKLTKTQTLKINTEINQTSTWCKWHKRHNIVMATCVLFRLQNKRLITSNALWRKNTNNILSLILDMNFQNFLHPSILDFLNGNMFAFPYC